MPNRRGSYLSEFLAGLHSRGYDVDNIYSELDILFDVRGAELRSHKTDRLRALVTKLQYVTVDEFGGALSTPCNPGVYSLMVNIVADSKTTGDLLIKGLNFYNTIRNDLTTNIELAGENCIVSSKVSGFDDGNARIFVVFWLLFWKKMCDWCSGRRIELKSVGINAIDDLRVSESRMLFRCEDVHTADTSYIKFDRKYLNILLFRLPSTAGVLSMSQALEVVFDHDNVNSYKSLVKKHLRLSLRDQHPGIDVQSAASHLGLSKLCLYRHLKLEGVTFQQLKDEVRQGIAIDRLHNRSINITAISEELGFSEPGAFSRAFKQWTGLSPAVYRDRLPG